MGCFSWKYCDSYRNGDHKRLRIGNEAYVVFPKDRGACGLPPGVTLYEPSYDGYGDFSGYDIYEIVADWNKPYITEANLIKPVRSTWSDDESGEAYYQAAVKRYEKSINRLRDFQDGERDEIMKIKYGFDWKRMIGIDIACYDDQNAALRYPVKICRFKKSVYENLPPSPGDPDQGF